MGKGLSHTKKVHGAEAVQKEEELILSTISWMFSLLKRDSVPL